MFENFEKYCSTRANLTQEDLNLIRDACVKKHVAKREFILREGESNQIVNFVAKGLLRLYRTDDKGIEYTLRFAPEDRWISDRESYLTGNPTKANIDAIEESEVLQWKKAEFDVLLEHIPAFKAYMKVLVARSQIANQNRVYTSISSSANEKYEQFLEKYPGLINRVPLHMVASFLGVTRETLSRARRHIF